jgi:polar amino acid transport system substrate-binding protein
MNRTVGLVVSLLVLMVVSVPAAVSQEAVSVPTAEPAAVKPLRFISSFDAPPFVYTEAGRKVGFEVDLGEAIGEALGRPVEWIQRPFNIPSLASELRAGRADAVLAALTATEGREQYFLFTIPYYRTSLAVATHRDVDWEPSAFRDGLSRAVRVGVLRRTTAEEWAQRNLQATRVTFDSPTRLARALNDREVGLILVDEPILRWELAKRHYKFKVVEQGIDSQVYAIGVSLSHPELVEELNGALRKLEKDGVYNEIYRKWYDATGRLPEIGR